MLPKKGSPRKKEAEGKHDNDGDIQHLLLEKDLEIETLLDKLLRLEKRVQSLTSLNEKQQTATKEMEEKLQDVISCLTSEKQAKAAKVDELEKTLKIVKDESTRSIEGLTKELSELKNTHKFVTEDLRLQLANAQVQLRDIDDFRSKKTAIEQEIAGLKEQLEKEKKEHQDSMSDVERSTLQEKEKLKKEMAARIEETKLQMLQQMDEQLHAKTKRTILENEQLAKELNYHIRHTELLLQKNEKLVQENIELHRQVLLAKEVEDDLSRRNRMNQKTMRRLLYKLREKHLTKKSGKNANEDVETLICWREQLRSNPYGEKQELENEKRYIQDETMTAEPANSAGEAIKFIYACLEDIEVANLSHGRDQQITTSSELISSTSDDGKSSLPSSLDQFTPQQRQEFLMHLLRTAMSLQAVGQNATHLERSEDSNLPVNSLCLPFAIGNESARLTVSVDDILNLSVESLNLDEPINRARIDIKVVSVGVQTDTMDLEERLALEIKERLQACSLGAEA